MRALGATLGLGLVLLASGTRADEVHLRNGGKVTGVIVAETPEAVVLETAPGRVTLPRSQIVRIEEGRSALQSYHERAAVLEAEDAEGWTRLARWAEDNDLVTASREAWHRVLFVDPGHPEANAALGRRYVDGLWMSEADAHRARGELWFERRWVTAAEHEALLREREVRALEARERREAELRVREAEARAREAEARAAEAEAAAGADEAVVGIPYWWVLAGGGGGFRPGPWHPRRPRACRQGPCAQPPVPPVQPPVVSPLRASRPSPTVQPSRPPRPPSRSRGAIPASPRRSSRSNTRVDFR